MPERRALAYAALASLGAHALLLSLSFPLRDGLSNRNTASSPILTRLVEPVAAIETTNVEPPRPRRQKPLASRSAAPPPAAPLEPSARTADEAGSVAQYRFQLAGVAARHHRYPPLALENGWEGDVLVRVRVAANGAVRDVSLQASSGHDALDEQALETFRAAVAEAPAPRALWGSEFSFELRASYSLRDRIPR